MCGIAGLIYADANGGREVGSDITRMLQSMKHRGPDSTGYALFGPSSGSYVMRFTLADANDPRDFEFEDRIRRNHFLVQQRLRLIRSAKSKSRGSFASASVNRMTYEPEDGPKSA